MEIKVLGTGCANCKALYVTVEQAVRDLNLDATLVKEIGKNKRKYRV